MVKMPDDDRCTRLDKLKNMCSISKCVKNVTGLRSDSTSPSDTWILHFKDTMYYDIPLSEGVFMKIWIDPDSVEDLEDYTILQDYIATLKGLDYEAKVYEDVIAPMVDKQMCPNFVRYVGQASKCSYDNLLKILTKSGKKSKEEWNENLMRNVNYMLLEESMRPSIDDDTREYVSKAAIRNMKKIRYNFLLAQAVSDDTTTLEMYTRDNNYNIEYDILLQILIACYAMETQRMNHNDLHDGNVWVKKLKRPTVVTYIINGNKYNITTSYKVLIYDFDRSFVKKLGPNPTLNDGKYVDQNGTLCVMYNQCNKFIPGKDVMKLFYYLMIHNDDNVVDMDNVGNEVLFTIMVKKGKFDVVEAMYNNGAQLQDEYGRAIDRSVFEDVLRPVETMIKKCYDCITDKFKPSPEATDPDSIFRM